MRTNKILILLALGPLLCWLPLLVLDSLPTHRQQPLRNRQPAALEPAGAGPPKPGPTIQRHQAKPSAPPGSKSRTRPDTKQTLSRPRPKTRPAPTPAVGAAKRPAASSKGVNIARRPPRPHRRQRKPAAPAPLPPAILSSIKTKAPSGAMLLGNLDLSSLEEKPMLTAARLERSRQMASPDPLSVVPKALKPRFLATIPKDERVIPAEIVRLPAPHLQAPEQIPLLLHPGGRAQGPTSLSSAATRQQVEGWLARQPAVANGSVRPVVLKLEPLPRSSTQAKGQPKTGASRSKAHRAQSLRAKTPRSVTRARRRQLGGNTSKPSGPSPSTLTPTLIHLDDPHSSAGTPGPPADRLPPATP